MKKLQLLLIALLCIALLCGCNEDQNPTTSNGGIAPSATVSVETNYCVTVVDAKGHPVTSGVIVSFISDGQTVGMQTLNNMGVAEKILPTDTYTIELGFTDPSVSPYYDQSDLTVTPEDSELTIVLSQGVLDSSMDLNAYSEVAGDHRSYTAHFVNSGETYVLLDAEDRTYVLFKPTEAGLYQFSVIGDATLGYYGMPHYVQQFDLSEKQDDGSFTVNISYGMIGDNETTGSTVMVLGIDSNTQGSCILSVLRLGDPELTIEDMPWDIYQTTIALSPYTLPDSIELREFDLTAGSGDYELVLDSSSGFYHLGSVDGPIVYAKLTEESAYLDSIETILESSAICKYFFDENGTYIKKESYSECLLSYIENVDAESGLYPLTNDLVYIFRQRGDYVGWWDTNHSMYLFVDSNGNPIPGINPDIAWLFLCCYGEETEIPVDPCANGHAFGSWVEVKAPTTQEEGLSSRECTVCGHTEQRKISKLDPEDTPVTEPDPKPSIGVPSDVDPFETGVVESFTTTVAAGTYNNYILYRVNGTIILTVRSEDAYVIYNGETYWPANGVVTLEIKAKSMMAPVEISIGNSGTEDADFTVLMGNPVGTLMNPAKLVLGTFTTKTMAGDEQGYYYEFTADTDGILTISLVSVDVDANCDFTLQSLDANRADGYQLSTSGTVSLSVKTGETVRITIGVYTDNFEYPAATVVTTATFE